LGWFIFLQWHIESDRFFGTKRCVGIFAQNRAVVQDKFIAAMAIIAADTVVI